ncbi:MAG: Gfo/Idh/MocA family protein [archaeon]
MSKNSKIKLGILGYGKIGKIHTNILRDNPDVSIIGVSDISSKCLRKDSDKEIKYFKNYKKLVSQVDAMIIATPHPNHLEQTNYCLDKEKHVFLEKPISHSIHEAKKILKKYNKNKSDLILEINFHHRTSPFFEYITNAINNNTIGNILTYEVTSSKWFRGENYFNQAEWRGTWKGEGGGILINQASHDLDLLFNLFGYPKKVQGVVQSNIPNVEVETNFQCIFNYENNMTGYVRASNSLLPIEEKIIFYGTKGTINYTNGTLSTHLFPETLKNIQKNTTDFKTNTIKQELIQLEEWDDLNGWKKMIDNFIDSINHKSSAFVSIDDAIGSLELANAITLSSLKDKSIYFPINQTEYKKTYLDLLNKKIKLERGGIQ